MNVQTMDITVTEEPIVLIKKDHFHVRVYQVILETETRVMVRLRMIWHSVPMCRIETLSVWTEIVRLSKLVFSMYSDNISV